MLFSKRLTAAFKEVKESMEGAQHFRMKSILNGWYSLKKVLVQIWAKLPSRGGEPFD